MAHIAPDQDEDNFFHVFTEDHDSDSSEEQIQAGQDLVQQATSSPPVPQTDSPQASTMDQGYSAFSTSAQVHSEQTPPPASRPQRIAGLHHQGGIVDNIVIAVDPPLLRIL